MPSIEATFRLGDQNEQWHASKGSILWWAFQRETSSQWIAIALQRCDQKYWFSSVQRNITMISTKGWWHSKSLYSTCSIQVSVNVDGLDKDHWPQNSNITKVNVSKYRPILFNRKLTPVSCRVTDTKSFARGSCISSTAGLAMSCRCTKAGVMCVLGLLECLCFSGLMFGWQAIATITARDHFFSHLCGSNSPATHASLVRHYVPVQNGTMFSILRNQKPHTTRITEGMCCICMRSVDMTKDTLGILTVAITKTANLWRVSQFLW